jgi:hypothetical protein
MDYYNLNVFNVQVVHLTAQHQPLLLSVMQDLVYLMEYVHVLLVRLPMEMYVKIAQQTVLRALPFHIVLAVTHYITLQMELVHRHVHLTNS